MHLRTLFGASIYLELIYNEVQEVSLYGYQFDPAAAGPGGKDPRHKENTEHGGVLAREASEF
jgi:hypothetical protein